MNKLSFSSLAQSHAAKPAFDPKALAIGVVHFGPGAFHRAHQAAFLDKLAADDSRWGICGVSLHSAGVRDALQAQDNLYTLAILDTHVSYQVIGSLRELLVAPEDPEAVFDRLTSPAVRVVTVTVTEKGYCLKPDFSLDFDHPDILADLAAPSRPKSLIGYLVEGLRRRQESEVPPFVLISCDNLPHNGARLKAAVVQFAKRVSTELADWIAQVLVCPSTMVDSITPATDDSLRARTHASTGLEETWPVQREAFVQWVIETHSHPDGPNWASVGVTLTPNVGAFEQAKLRLLNASHSFLAYTGSNRGYDTVGAAMGDVQIAEAVTELMMREILPTLPAVPGLDLADYANSVLRRFRNPEIHHKLAQIAWDGSQKLPIRILPTLIEAMKGQGEKKHLVATLAEWMHFIGITAKSGLPIVDPLSEKLREVGLKTVGDPSDILLFLQLETIFPTELSRNGEFISALAGAYARVLHDR